MKKIFIVLITLLISGLCFADLTNFLAGDESFKQSTLFNGTITSLGGYGGPIVEGDFINNQLYPAFGGEGGAIINHSFIIGGTGKAILLKAPDSNGEIFGSRMAVGYGGLMLGYILMPEEVIHPFVKGMIGAGGISYYDGTNKSSLNSQSFFVMEANIGMELNIIKWFRIDPYIGYRYVNGGIDMKGFDDSKLSGLQFGVNLRFGIF